MTHDLNEPRFAVLRTQTAEWLYLMNQLWQTRIRINQAIRRDTDEVAPPLVTIRMKGNGTDLSPWTAELAYGDSKLTITEDYDDR
jgi:hypothetical protein